MDSRNLEKAMELYSKLMMGEEIKKAHPVNGDLYEEYVQNAEVYEIFQSLLKQLNLNLYEYNNSLFLTAGEGNRVFGFTNEELKKSMGLKYNKELYLCYFIIYQIILSFYSDTAVYQYVEYVKLEDIMEKTTESLYDTLSSLDVLVRDEIEENSFKTIALIWDELPMVIQEEYKEVRASRACKASYVKLVFNFLVNQGLFLELDERYYPKDRLKALIENYFEQYKGRLYEMLGKVGKE